MFPIGIYVSDWNDIGKRAYRNPAESIGRYNAHGISRFGGW
jgi:hypothetical protein